MLKPIAFGLVGAMTVAQAVFAAGTMTITSPDIAPGARIADEQVFNGFGCTGKNVSPAPLGRPVTSGGMLNTTQCQNPLPVGASGS